MSSSLKTVQFLIRHIITSISVLGALWKLSMSEDNVKTFQVKRRKKKIGLDIQLSTGGLKFKPGIPALGSQGCSLVQGCGSGSDH